MATGALGGVPTTTLRTFFFSSPLTNFVFYTAPSNTLVFVDLMNIETSGFAGLGGGLGDIGVRTPTGYGGFNYRSVYSGGAANGNISGTSGYNLSTGNLQARLIDRQGSNQAPISLYPGEDLYLTYALGSPNAFTSATLTYATLEVTSG